MMQLETFVFNPLQENTFVLYDETKECVIIDPGCYDKSEQYELEEFIAHKGLIVKMLLNTHCHVDHVLGNYFVKEKYKVKLLIHEKDEITLKAVQAYAPAYGFHQYQPSLADGFLNEGDTISFGNQSLKVLFVPGHAPGHIAFFNEKEQILIGGDVLFYNSIGRTDLPGGNYDTLIQSIHQKLFTLPDTTKVYPGHGQDTTIGFEKRTNPFCALTYSN
ncbi:MBL fold metallo-hydrolase [Chryseosolibacter indicus]|uniref:MBL fold metallo-hydrolase n=1 Tax=Chryseosolibacter indicus TaxID=2782351 RepID=A0ABS5VKV2_9BACT|nr:MBL fold metallo-hydrolase [Chryseosolibacter indicus]MBT1702006.1 MBL fold metallo-hydrolase [Chryseosolibacter indicus]